MTISPENKELVVSGLGLSWEGKPICENISFTLDSGEVVCLVGKSGSGKSTIFHALAGLSDPDEGSITLDGENIVGKPGHISYMLQKDLLVDQHTILDNVSFPLRVKGAKKGEARNEASPYFQQFGIEGTQGMYPSQLSGGMRQRAALLRTYLMGGDVVLLDEPFSALDSMTRRDMQQWLLGMVSELHLSAMLITHDIDEAVFLADKVLVLSWANGETYPSTIVATFDIDCPRDQRASFVLSPRALDIKRDILALLG